MVKSFKLKKLDTRGGARKKKKSLSAYSLLLQALWVKFGGVPKVARLLGEVVQTPVNWKLRGAVAIEKVLSARI